ncbi:MAG: MATE family efflux transporter [Ruthenibacterium lactatiformans]
MSANILSLALPLTVAQLINVLYNVVDRIYIGHIPGASSAALTGVGVTFPILSIVIAFANLFGTGGAPLFSIARGRGDDAHAADIMGNTFTMLLGTGLVLTAGARVQKPLLYLFGASDATFPYADGYLTIYLCGTVFVMLGLGMNNFINAQGFGSMGMITVLLGAVVNIILDPVFIFALGMGVQAPRWQR